MKVHRPTVKRTAATVTQRDVSVSHACNHRQSTELNGAWAKWRHHSKGGHATGQQAVGKSAAVFSCEFVACQHLHGTHDCSVWWHTLHM